MVPTRSGGPDASAVAAGSAYLTRPDRADTVARQVLACADFVSDGERTIEKPFPLYASCSLTAGGLSARSRALYERGLTGPDRAHGQRLRQGSDSRGATGWVAAPVAVVVVPLTAAW